MSMIKHLISILICFSLGSIPSFAQSIITGQVCTDKGVAVEYARVLALAPKDSTIITYAFTDDKGAYRLSINSKLPEVLLTVSSMEIAKSERLVRNVSQTCHFTVKEAVTTLREVQVKARKVWGQKDTINYSVASFAGKQDVVIADVLKKMPGIEVSLEGLIKYNGKAINKFYIEGLDALQGRYGIATNNISAKDVATVQVLENHQPIKALEDARPSDDAAINLKLKPGVKGAFGVNAQLGLGYDTRLRRNEELTGMYFSKQRQHILTAKSNDSGQSVRKELRSFYSTSSLPALQLTSVSHPTSPSFRTERHYFNDTHAFTANNLFKLEGDAELNVNLIFYHDRERRHGGSRTIYHLGASDQLIEEDIESRLRTNELEAELRYNKNGTKGYFNNFLRLQGEWGRESATLLGAQSLAQALRQRYLGAENSTHWIKRGKGGRGFELMWRNGIATRPQRLGVSPGPYADRLNASVPYEGLLQDVQHRAMASDLRLSLLSALRLWGISISPTAFLKAQHSTLDTELGLVATGGAYSAHADAEMHNDLSYSRLSAGIGQELSYKSESLKISAQLPLFYHYTLADDHRGTGGELSKGRLQFTPSLWVSYNLSPELSLKLDAGISESLPELNALYTGYLLTSYRSLGRHRMQMYYNQQQTAGLSVAYKDIFSMLFVGGGLSYAHYNSDAISTLTLDGPLRITERLALPHSGQSLALEARGSKGFDWCSMTLTAEGRLGRGTGRSYLQGFLRGYENEWLRTKTSLSMKPFAALTLSYDLRWGLRRSRTEGTDWLPSVRSLSHEATAHLSLGKSLSIKLSGEHYYNSAVTEGRHFTLADLGVIYTLGKTRLSLDWTNIFSAKTYTAATVGDLISSYSYYHLRPTAVMLRVRFKLL